MNRLFVSLRVEVTPVVASGSFRRNSAILGPGGTKPSKDINFGHSQPNHAPNQFSLPCLHHLGLKLSPDVASASFRWNSAMVGPGGTKPPKKINFGPLTAKSFVLKNNILWVVCVVPG